ncbi:flagellar basal-body MS-ring/collar protein FliF [Timonella senegalensis]|uniref:flagellar basal-body MS-ring/collar protein FliF n=1 Tax=Timonella senegalensis TaxID=1465825 RepID=UPI0002E9CC3A|nr:flagellar basal-body MS-ring/collar protein FliF [Timonella senegalensis]
MPQQITSAFAKLLAMVRAFTVAQRTIALIGLALLVVAIVAVASWISTPQMRALYSDLAPADASAIVEQLGANGVPYELTNGGATVLVPADQVYEQRLKIAASGLTPTEESGYSLLDGMGLTASSFQQTVTYKRALEGELASTLSAMAGVETATVQLALPEESVFVSQTPDPSASVFVKAKGGSTFSDDQVQAMVQFVSSSVPGMDPQGVSVVDASGAVLSAEGGIKNASSNKQTAEYEGRVQSNIQAMLDRIVGPGNAVVSVTADLDFDATERTSEKFESDKDALPLTERTTSEEYTGTGSNATGVLGPDNIAVPNGDSNGRYTNTAVEKANSVDKITEHTKTAPGTVRRQSVSVAVSAAAAQSLNMQDVEDMVASAAGIDAKRGDTVLVTRLAFDDTAALAAQEALAQADAQAQVAAKNEMYRNIAIAVLILVAFIVFAVRRKRRRAAEQTVDGELINEIGAPGTFDTEPFDAVTLLNEIEMPEIPELPTSADLVEQAAERKRQDVVVLADQDPAQVANHLRELMEVGR